MFEIQKSGCGSSVNPQNKLVDLQEEVNRFIGDGSNFWEAITSVIKDAKNHLEGDKVKIAFAGKMKAGKSTLVNMILGEDLSATGITPATKTIIEFHCDLDDPRIEFIKSERVCSKIPLDEEGKREVQRKMTAFTSEFDFIRIYCDKPILSRFVLVDVPGTADLDRGVEKKIREYLCKNEVATIIWVSETSTSLPKDECDYIKELMGLGKNMIFVLNCKTAFTEEDKNKFKENFKKNIPGYEPFIFSVKKEEKPQIVRKNGEDDSDFERRRSRLEGKYEEASAAQRGFVGYLNKNSKEIKAKNGMAVLNMVPNEFEKVLYALREESIQDRKALRDEFFNEFIPKLSTFANSIKYLSSDLDSWWNKKCTSLDNKIKNNSGFFGNKRDENDIIDKWQEPIFGEIQKKIDDIFNKFVDFDQYEFVDLDFVQTAILLKEARMECELNRFLWNISNLSFGYAENIESVKETSRNNIKAIVSSVKFFFTLIIEDCFRRFIASHNDIWNNYLDKKYAVIDCMKKTKISFGEKSLFSADEFFATTPDYDAWVDETLSIYGNELLSDEKLTNSEAKLFRSFYTALGAEKDMKSYLKKGSQEALLYPVTFRLKAETTEGAELRFFIYQDYSWNDNNFDIQVKTLDEIKKGEHKDFNDFFIKFILNSSVSKIRDDADLNYNFMPEDYKD